MPTRGKHHSIGWISVVEVLPLEPRVFLSAGALHAAIEAIPAPAATASLAKLKKIAASASASSLVTGGVPVLNSDPRAPVTIYLDFDGDTTASWMGLKPGVTPAYDRDGRPDSFSSAEIAGIREIWTRVAEFYSPFQVNVTTQNPGTLADRKAVRIVFGGTGKWVGERVGGIAAISGFFNSRPNTAFVFTDNLNNGDPASCAIVAAHEAGHLFGLEHQSTWNGQQLAEEYHPGDARSAPIMGANYQTRRNLWWTGPSIDGHDVIQDDLALLTDPANGLAWRPDDYADTLAGAHPVSLGGPAAKGVIGRLKDVDVFSFKVAKSGFVDVAAATPIGGMLAYTLELLDAGGKVLRNLSGVAENRIITADLPAGSYYVRIASHKGMGDVGQYSLRVAPGNPPPPTPVGVKTISKSHTEIVIRWEDRSGHERGFVVQRSLDGKIWTHARRFNANQTIARDIELNPDTRYYYRVLAYNTAGFSKSSVVVEGRTRPTPVNLSTKGGSGSGGSLTARKSGAAAAPAARPFSAAPIAATDELLRSDLAVL